MSRIAAPAIESATGASAEVYAQVGNVDRGAAPDLFAVLGRLAPRVRHWANWPFRVQSPGLRAGVVGRR